MLAILGVSQCSLNHQRHASATLLLVYPLQSQGSSGTGSNAELIPNAPLSSPVVDLLVRSTQEQRFARSVAGAGGSAHFDVRADGLLLLVRTSSSKRREADETLTVVMGLLTKKLAASQRGSREGDSLRLEVVTTSGA
jgi:hypothetical protein